MIYIKLQNCFFFFEVYFEAPKMYRNQLSNICNEFHFFCLQFYEKYASLQVLLWWREIESEQILMLSAFKENSQKVLDAKERELNS